MAHSKEQDMKRVLLTVVLTAAMVSIGRAAQAPPDLSGTWRPQNPNSGQVNPFEFTITQTADSVTIRTPLNNPESVTLKLNGETRVPLGSGQGGAPVVTGIFTAGWEGPKLVVGSSFTGGRGGPSSAKAVYSLSGDTLTLDASNSLPDGSMSPVRTVTYVKYTPTPMPAPPTRTVEAGYVSLFNGKDLTGWKASMNPDSFKVENGAIVANAVGGPSHLFYDGSVGNHAFQNFDLRLDVLARYRSNGGVYVMTEFQPQGFPGKGFEIQVNNSHSDRIRTGSLYHVVDLSNIPGKDDEWIPMEIKAQGNTIAVTVKGQEVVHWTQPADWQSNYDTASRKIAPGTIAFQSHDTYSVTAYSNIRLKLLN
jgi:3-keto-disaccharide hydrolase